MWRVYLFVTKLHAILHWLVPLEPITLFPEIWRQVKCIFTADKGWEQPPKAHQRLLVELS